MRNGSIICVFFVLGVCKLFAQQNLVPNWSFETITQCPNICNGTTTAPYAVGWLNPNNGSADLFSNCDTQICGGWNQPCNATPSNCWGWQTPHSGVNYAGIAFYGATNSNAREYLEIKLIDSLQKSKSYCISYYASLADSFAGYATSRLGAYLSPNFVSNYNQFLIPVVPQVENPFGIFLSIPQLWYNVSGIYVATGGEQYMTIGNFFNDNNTDTMRVQGASNWRPGVYYFVDDVSIVEYAPAYVGNDTTICLSGKVKPRVSKAFQSQYSWSVIYGDLNSIDSANASSPTLSPSVTTVYVLEKRQCTTSTFDTLTVHVPAKFPACLGNDTTICAGDSCTINAAQNCNWCTHSWNTGSAGIQVLVSPTQAMTLTFSQQDSCFVTTDALVINVDYCASPIVTIPNIFTPNSDGLNDTWIPSVINDFALSNYSIEIYDRWGLQLFKSDSLREGWSGRTTSGIECREGTYFYLIKYFDQRERKCRSQQGFIQLMR